MSNLLMGRTRLVGLAKNSRQILRLALLVNRNDARKTKRFFVSQVNRVLFKNFDPEKNRFSGSKSCQNPCAEKTSERSEASAISKTISCNSDQPKSSVDCCQSRGASSSGDSRPRDCKLGASSGPVETPAQKHDLEAIRPPFTLPVKENIRKGRVWRLITLLGAVPVSVILSIVVKIRSDEEAKNPRPDYVPMDYMYRRTKRFPWGDGNHTFFHNPERNAVPPHGYEVEDPNQVQTEG